MLTYERGEVWLIDLGYAAKIRPCLIMSIPPLDEDRALITVIPHTTSPRGSRFDVAVSTTFHRSGVSDAQNPITTNQSKLIRKLGGLSDDQLRSVESAL
jgi:mRNA interferase MazF